MVITCVVFVLILNTNSIISPPAGDFIWTSKSTYCFGEYVEIYFGCSYGCMGEAEVVLCTPDGCSTRYKGVITDYDQIGGQAGPPAGKRVAKLYIDGDLVDTVTYWVEDCDEDEDPCIYMLCPDYECRGCDYYENIGCENGECLFTLVERNSPKCGSGCGDPCEGKECPPECYDCDYWAMECDDGDCVRDYIIEEDSKRCGCGDPCDDVDGSTIGSFIIDTLVQEGLGRLIDSKLAGVGFGVYLKVVQVAGESARMEIVLSEESKEKARFISPGNIAITEGQTINMHLKFMPATGVQTYAWLTIDYQETLEEWITIASWEFRNSEFEGNFIGIGCIDYEIFLNDTATPGYFTFKEPGDYLVKARIQGASDQLRVRVFPEQEDDEPPEDGICLGTLFLLGMLVVGEVVVYTKSMKEEKEF